METHFGRFKWGYLAACLILGLSLIVNLLAVPNTLSHDKLNNELFLIKSGDPSLFPNDFFLRGNSWHFFYVPFVEFLRFANNYTGSSEATYRLLVPVSFFIFVFGMFLFLYRMKIPFLISLGVATASSFFIDGVLHDNWGIPGPSMITPRHLGLALLTFAFYLFYKYYNHKNLKYVFLLVGLIGNIHQVSAFYVTLIFLGALFMLRPKRWQTIKELFTFGLYAVIGVLPFLFWRLVLYPPDPSALGFAPVGDQNYLDAFWTSQSHMSPSGMAKLYRDYFLERWYTIWPLIAVFLATYTIREKHADEETTNVNMISRSIFLSTAAITLFITLIQQFLQLVFKIPPVLIEEPRAFRFIYFILYLYLGFFLAYLWNRFSELRGVSALKKISAGLTALACTGILIFIVGEKVLHIDKLIASRKENIASANTCAPPIYQWIKDNTPKESLFLIDPNRFPPFRICAERGLVYHYRDGAAIAPSSGTLVEWYRRKLIIDAAYEKKDPPAILRVADQFQANYILTEQCIPLKLTKIYEENGTNCVYAIKP